MQDEHAPEPLPAARGMSVAGRRRALRALVAVGVLSLPVALTAAAYAASKMRAPPPPVRFV
jgi:hypothetical protein